MSGPTVVDLVFKVIGTTIPQDHGYALYAAMARVITPIHGATDIGIFPMRGMSTDRSALRLTPASVLRVRLPAEKIPALLPLAGKSIELDGQLVRIGVPHVALLIPAPMLMSDLVTIKLAQPKADDEFVSPTAFFIAARKQLEREGVQGVAHLLAHRAGPKQGQPWRRVVRIKGQTHVGYGMAVDRLTAEESILLQERGLGGRRLMGCGLFLPVKRQL